MKVEGKASRHAAASSFAQREIDWEIA